MFSVCNNQWEGGGVGSALYLTMGPVASLPYKQVGGGRGGDCNLLTPKNSKKYMSIPIAKSLKARYNVTVYVKPAVI
jgi:hypothetical protein